MQVSMLLWSDLLRLPEQGSLWLSFLLCPIGQMKSRIKPRDERSVAGSVWAVCYTHAGWQETDDSHFGDRQEECWSFVGRERCYRCCFYRQPHIVAYTGLKPMAILPQPPEFWDYSYQAWREKGFFFPLSSFPHLSPQAGPTLGTQSGLELTVQPRVV